MKKFDLIVIVQSYPNLIDAVNFVLAYGDKNILILVNGDHKIFEFLQGSIQKENISIKLYGNNIFLRSRFFSWLLPLYVCYLHIRMPRFLCTEKLITYGNWCDIGAIFHFKVESNRVTNLVASEEKRYTIESAGYLNLPLFIKILNFFTGDLIERKTYFYEEDGKTKFIERDSYGLVGLDPSTHVLRASREKNYSLIEYSFKESEQPFVLLIEKNLIKSKVISYYGFLKLNLAIYRFSKNNKIAIRIKFKPRDTFFLRRYFYRLFGFTTLSTSAPAQLFAMHKNCKCVIGFSSSAMAENYGKPVYCFGSIKKLFNPTAHGNINSLRQRSIGNESSHFLDDIKDLENLVV
jgi:hypothetical protein